MTERKEQVFISEDLEPMVQHCVGRWFRICEEATEANLMHECHNFWFGVRAFNKLAIACNNARDRDGAVHFSIACGNLMREVSKYIEGKTGESPLSNESGMWK